jgi:anti-repressor protein
MNELIKIYDNQGKNDLGQKIVDAKDLHTTLEVKTKFTDWIKRRISEYGFTEGIDFVSFSQIWEKPQGGRPSNSYAITLDMAKELAMIENNEQGRKVRQYFIAVEKEARKLVFSVPQNFAEALELAARQQRSIEGQAKEIAKLKPKAEFVERSIDSEGLTEMSMAVKVLGFPYGRNIFYKLLRKAGVFFKNRNEPLQQYIEMGFFVVKQKIITRKVHTTIVVNVPFMTQKGMLRMSAWLSERGYFDQNKVLNFIAK